MPIKLTIGMATYDDFDGVFFTIQALKMFHPCENFEFIVLDNNPTSTHGNEIKNYIENSVKGKYIPFTERVSSFNKYEIVKHATNEYVLIIDCHVLIVKDGISKLLEYFENNKDTKDLIQGPLLYDALDQVSTHFDPVWRNSMYGIWGCNKEAYKLGNPFEIQMQGMGLLAFKKSSWPKICEDFIGFGGEEGYISEKFRQNGGKNLCLPCLQWNQMG